MEDLYVLIDAVMDYIKKHPQGKDGQFITKIEPKLAVTDRDIDGVITIQYNPKEKLSDN